VPLAANSMLYEADTCFLFIAAQILLQNTIHAIRRIKQLSMSWIKKGDYVLNIVTFTWHDVRAASLRFATIALENRNFSKDA
jgi:hypothetical protein